MTQVFVQGHDGHEFLISGDMAETGVILGQVNGLVSEVSREVRVRSTAVGGDVRARTIEVMPGSLKVWLRRSEYQTLSEVWDMWKSAWSTDHERPTRLRLVVGGWEWNVDVFAEQNLPVPNPGPSSPGINHIESDVSVIALDGAFSGEPRDYTGGGVHHVSNPGTLTMFPDLYWSGSGEQVTLPDGRVVALPAVTGEHRMSTDPGKGFKVWGPDGVEATSVWTAFRGLDVRAPVPAGESVTITGTAGVWLRATPRHENPWR